MAVLKPIAKISGIKDLKRLELWPNMEDKIRQAEKAGTFEGFRRLNAKGEKWVNPAVKVKVKPASPGLFKRAVAASSRPLSGGSMITINLDDAVKDSSGSRVDTAKSTISASTRLRS